MAPLLCCAGLLALGLACACGSGGLQPQLVLEALAITHARATGERRDLSRDYTVTAAVSLPVDSGVEAGAQIDPAWRSSVDARVHEHEHEAAIGCDEALRALCTWAQRAEDAAWTVLLTESWVTP